MTKTNSPTKISMVGLATVIISVVITILISWVLYQHTVNLLTQNLRQRLISVARTAAVQFSAEDLQELQTEEDWKKPNWAKVVNQLKKIRLNNDNVLFAYIIRKDKRDPAKMVFVSDSHSINPYAKIDISGDGKIDDADLLQWPGQEYEDPPQEAFEAYSGPITSRELIQDQWGIEIVGYAPIKNDSGETVAVMAVDMKADDFFSITRQTFLPFLSFIFILILIIFVLATILIRIWNRRVELMAELDRQKDELLGIVSHQLAAPITAIKWYLELLNDKDAKNLDEEQKETLATLQGVTNTLSDLVSMILDVSRIQLGRMNVESQPLNVNNFLKEILDVVSPKAKEGEILFKINIPNQIPEMLLDKRLTRMTIENLLTNAIKYTSKGGSVTFKVSLDTKLHFIISDTGCGIPKIDQTNIFKKLYRASNVRNGVAGNGFGLYVAKGAVESQGGQIWFESIEGKGTTFFIDLPFNLPKKE